MYGITALGLCLSLQGLLVKMDISQQTTEKIFGSLLDESELRDMIKLCMEEGTCTNRPKARKILKKIAKAHGFNSPILYRGQRRFGETTFAKRKHGIFLTDDPLVARIYANDADIQI